MSIFAKILVFGCPGFCETKSEAILLFDKLKHWKIVSVQHPFHGSEFLYIVHQKQFLIG